MNFGLTEINDGLKKYKKGYFLNSGGFAECYTVNEISKSEGAADVSYALKVMFKDKLMEHPSKSVAFNRVIQEIEIHKKLSHPNVVKIHSAFEDDKHVYLLLELCELKSLFGVIKRRRSLLAYESKYYLKQLAQGLEYLHSNNIVHRDIKPGNLLLTNDMVLKIGDFGFSFKLDQAEDEQYECGTRYFKAPEVYNNGEHTPKMDIWSAGYVLYVCLTGRHAFTNSNAIRDGTFNSLNWKLPDDCRNENARKLMERCFQEIPEERPSASEMLSSEFLSGEVPKALPRESTTTEPFFFTEQNLLNYQIDGSIDIKSTRNQPLKEFTESTLKIILKKIEKVINVDAHGDIDDLHLQCPKLKPLYWVNRWVDYSDKYGFVYQICDGSFGCIFRDNRTVIVSSNGVYCVEKKADGSEKLYLFDRLFSEEEQVKPSKKEILQKFHNYMKKYLKPAASQTTLIDSGSNTIGRSVFVISWMRIEDNALSADRKNVAIAFLLSSSTFQINFKDGVKLIICPLVEAVTVIQGESFKTFSLEYLTTNGSPQVLHDRLNVVHTIISNMKARV